MAKEVEDGLDQMVGRCRGRYDAEGVGRCREKQQNRGDGLAELEGAQVLAGWLIITILIRLPVVIILCDLRIEEYKTSSSFNALGPFCHYFCGNNIII